MRKAKAVRQDSTREAVLKEAAFLTAGDRNDAYNDPKINMQAMLELQEWFERWRSHPSVNNVASAGGHDAAITMVLAKLARIAVGAPKADNYVDAAAYLAMAWECHLDS
jgi:hypothetical protein